ncbi:unnamed protein product [[Actinomadura] parvosata subsp. kistnae]|uniref:Uncharacterized protein n=1 Tax=[Actinomadura] parvosata subsp. kistnae TaxID=1909395 RepID=A0A1U9ZZ05_9ACTN|nr:hypothetical protein [Nonomuraea sp. ATCC 55076]AQZ63185.1 hypothetical protein BKM31_18490 [Nonomuraea sp. ATCC 55076]SPL98843.1 unnamed protein product [Actinomadura parvosata subsp. kistnae]
MASVSALLAKHTAFRLSCVDRIFAQGYVPGLQTEGMVVRFLLHRGYPIPSPAGLGVIHERLIADIHDYAAAHDIAMEHFPRRACKEDIVAPYLRAAAETGRDSVVYIGIAQERVSGWRGFRRGGSDRHPHFCYRRQALWVNHYYFYVWDRRFGPGFFKLCPYAPYPVWAWCNGHEWLKQQLIAAGVAFRALDNGIRDCAEPRAAQHLADTLDAGHVRGFLNRWLSRLPSPLTGADQAAGFGYDWSIRQIEFSDTAVFDQPANGRAWFDAAIKEHLDLGRPEKVTLVVDRRIMPNTPGRFATQVITRDIDPTIQIHYKSSKVKAYLKDGRALRVETTINNPRDFGVRKPLTVENWTALRQAGTAVNTRFLDAVGRGAPPPPDVTTLQQVVLPSTHEGLRAPGLRFGDPRVMALLATLATFGHLIGGLTNATLVAAMQPQLDHPYTRQQATYDLRRLRRKGLIERLPGHNRYRITPYGRQIACFFTKLSARVVVPTLTDLDQLSAPDRPAGRPLSRAWRYYERTLTELLTTAGLTT